MMIVRTVLALLAAVILAGCLPVTSKKPVGTTAGFKTDPALFGTWKGHSGDEQDQRDAFFHFLKNKDGLTAAVVEASGENDDEWTIYDVHTAVLGDHRYLNAIVVMSNGQTPEDKLKGANIPLLYVIKGRTLTLYLFDEEKVKAAITAGAIKGTIEPGDNGDVAITADASELDAFMAKPETATLFKAMLVLKKAD